jgi:hypothetical protein
MTSGIFQLRIPDGADPSIENMSNECITSLLVNPKWKRKIGRYSGRWEIIYL